MTHGVFQRSAMLAAVLFAATAGAQTPSPVHTQVAPIVSGMYPSLETLYKDIHTHPELAFQEARTAAKLAGEMRELGFEVTERRRRDRRRRRSTGTARARP